MNSNEIEAKITELDKWIRSNQSSALREFSFLTGKDSVSVHVMHAHFGRNNNTFVDSVRTQFTGSEDFIALWVNGLQLKLSEIKIRKQYSRYGRRKYSEEIVYEALQNQTLRMYILKFLERNFYRNFRARIRAKPDDALWSIWFGSGNLSWGLVISPAWRNTDWTNDKSQMRREQYYYWTLGHVLATGLIDSESDQPLTFRKLSDFYKFYRSVLKRVSNSSYEKGICDRYLDYVSHSNAPLLEPLLIPELRYAGKDTKHKHRLDFAILNDHTSQLTGFELSPASTHISVKGMKNKTQKAVNEGLAASWEKEIGKRNDYFEKFGISTITFVDGDLRDLDACFEKMQKLLQQRSTPPASVEQALRSLSESWSR